MALRNFDSYRVPPTDEVLNILDTSGRPVRWNIDQQDRADYPVYTTLHGSFIAPAYTVRAPRTTDRRVIDVYYDVHPNEVEQGLIGRSLEADNILGVAAYRINHIATPGKRKKKYNMNLLFPGDRHNAYSSEIRLAELTLRQARLRNPDVAFELHNTPLADDAMLFMQRKVGSYVGRVAGYLSDLYNLPIVEPAPTMFCGNFDRSMAVEMPTGDPRFGIAAWRTFLGKLANNDITLPDQPAKPHYSYHSELRTKDWKEAGQTTEQRAAFSPLPEAAIARLGLPAGSRTANWVGGRYKYIGMVVAPFSDTSDPHTYDPRKTVMTSCGIQTLQKPRIEQWLPAV